MSDAMRELLVRGIAAAKTNDPKDTAEARYYLKRVINASDAGYDHKAIAWLWLSQIESVRPEDYGVDLRFTGPLWDSATMHRMFVEKANVAIGDTDKSKEGIMGQNWPIFSASRAAAVCRQRTAACWSSTPSAPL